MSHPQPPQRQPTLSETDRYARTIHNVALCALVACPAVALLPPRTTAYSANYLTRERTGRSIWQHVGGANESMAAAESSPMSAEQSNLNKDLQSAREEMQRLQAGSKLTAEHSQAAQSARDAWKAQREKEIQDDLDVGKGFGEMITDQIYEVWNWTKKRDDEDED
ncbi:hypothetical protein LTR17_014971 [Elasticomyces elasticus]|nr:hypothetical protein LTR17_014971 [Elasticomyces elasticus]